MPDGPETDEPVGDEQVHARGPLPWLGKVIVDRDGERIGNCRTSAWMSRPTNRSSAPSRRASSVVT